LLVGVAHYIGGHSPVTRFIQFIYQSAQNFIAEDSLVRQVRRKKGGIVPFIKAAIQAGKEFRQGEGVGVAVMKFVQAVKRAGGGYQVVFGKAHHNQTVKNTLNYGAEFIQIYLAGIGEGPGVGVGVSDNILR